MSRIAIMEVKYLEYNRRNWLPHLIVQKYLIEKHFDWLTLKLSDFSLVGEGAVPIQDKKFNISLKYSPFYRSIRKERISITNEKIKFNHKIHVYGDLTLCLYHPILDSPYNGIMPLFKMIPWISEWCHFYEEWKKYRVWLAPEIKHDLI